VYIGQTVRVRNRFIKYKSLDCDEQPKIYNSLKKYGPGKHKFEVIAECDQSDLNKMERYYQDLYHACGPKGLNCKFTGYEQRSGSLSDELKKKISDGNKGKVVSAESRAKMSAAKKGKAPWNTGISHPAGTRAKIGEKAKGNTRCLGRIANKETLERMKTSNLHRSKSVICVQTNVTYPSIHECSRQLGINVRGIQRCLKGETKNGGKGYTFMYTD
jgi:group I intron endonuclease